MAHTALHFSIGLAAGALLSAPPVVRKFRRTGQSAMALGIWLGAAYALGIFASVPNILRWMGVPELACSGWWMNVCLFHPLIDDLESGGMLVGELLFAACFGLQYLVLLITLRWVRRRSLSPAGTS